MWHTALRIAPLVFLCSACSDDVVHVADTALPTTGWSRTERPEFCFVMNDTLTRHNVFIDVRHTGDYPYQDLFLFVELNGPHGLFIRDTVECLLADPTGRWYGKGAGSLFADELQAHVLYKMGNRFPRKGEYCLRLEQAMRAEPLTGVVDVGVTVARMAER